MDEILVWLRVHFSMSRIKQNSVTDRLFEENVTELKYRSGYSEWHDNVRNCLSAFTLPLVVETSLRRKEMGKKRRNFEFQTANPRTNGRSWRLNSHPFPSLTSTDVMETESPPTKTAATTITKLAIIFRKRRKPRGLQSTLISSLFSASHSLSICNFLQYMYSSNVIHEHEPLFNTGIICEIYLNTSPLMNISSPFPRCSPQQTILDQSDTAGGDSSEFIVLACPIFFSLLLFVVHSSSMLLTLWKSFDVDRHQQLLSPVVLCFARTAVHFNSKLVSLLDQLDDLRLKKEIVFPFAMLQNASSEKD